MPTVQPPKREVDEPMGMAWTWGRVATVVAVLAMVLFWVWIFSGAPARENADRLTDQAYVDSLEAQCETLRADLAELPNAADLPDQAARADVLDDANVIVAGFISELEAGAPTEGDAAVTIDGWIGDWKIYLDNRESYAERLRTEENAQLLLDASPLGDSVDKTIEVFSQVNRIDACATPGDVG